MNYFIYSKLINVRMNFDKSKNILRKKYVWEEDEDIIIVMNLFR